MAWSLAGGRASIVVVLLGLWLVLAPRAQAAPGYSPPSGWAEGAAADEQARRRADAWAKAWGADVRQVLSTSADDGFAETLAILDVATPIPAAALGDLESSRAWLEPRVTEALGPTATLDPEGLELRSRSEPGVAVLRARVHVGERLAHIAVAPTGARHLAVILLLPEAEEVLYASVFDDAVDGLAGLRRTIAPVDRGLLRTIALFSWLVVGTALAVVWTRRSLPRPGARVAGRQAAVALLVTAVLVLLIAGTLLGDASVELALAGTTPWGFAFELALGGLAMAALVLVATELWERRLRPVASAPESGTWAVTPTASRRAVPTLVHPTVPGPAVTGDTQVGRPPAVTGDTQVGRPPAVTGNTKVGPAPQAIEDDDGDGGPPVREIISGDIEVQTQIRRIPEPDTVKTIPPRPPAADPSVDEDTNPRAVPSEGPASVSVPRDGRSSVPSVPRDASIPRDPRGSVPPPRDASIPRDARGSVPSVPRPDARGSVPSVPRDASIPRDARGSVPSVPRDASIPRDPRGSVPLPPPRAPRVEPPARAEDDPAAPPREPRPKLEIDWS